MKEIKFRAYDADDKVMRSWEEIDFTKDIGDDYYLVGYKTSAVSIKYDHEQMIMQYTGLKDKNGVEIYEGDIVKWSRLCLDFRLENYEERSDNFVVEWDVYNTGFVLGDGEAFLYKDISAELEVIGNIYENPELLG